MTRLDERYKQVKVIGSGSFGHAILCTRRCDSKDVVVKVMQPDSCNKHSVMNEVKILKHLCHPNIVTFLAAWREGSRIYICMEYADGGDLKLAIQQQKSLQTPFDERTIQCWMLQLSGALYYLHSVKVLHRDLKAANVFLTDDKKVIKLGDFGISKQLHSTAEFAKTALGTPFYLSPEIVSGKKYNAKSDIWAAGIIMHELMTFHYPFKAKTQRELFQLIKNGLRTSHPNLSHYKEGLVQLMESMLIVDTAYRYSALKVMLHESLRGKYLLGGNGPLQTPELPPLAGVARTEEEAPVSVTHSDGARVARSVPPPNTRHDRVLPKQRAASSRKSPSYAIAAVVRAACLKNFQAMLAAVAGGLVTVLQKVVFPLKQGRVLRIPYGSRHAWHPLPSYTPQNYTTRKKQNAQKMLQKVLENLNTTLARVDETGQEQIQSGKDGDFEDHMPELTGTLNKSLGLFSFKGHANMQGITVKDTLHTQAEGLFKVLDDLLGTALLLQLLELSEDSTTLSADYAYKASKLLGKDKTHYLHLVCWPPTGQPEARPALDYSSEGRMTLLMRFCVVVAGVGGLGFGYDLGVIVGGLPEIVREFKLNGLEEGIVVAGASVGQILGAVVGGYVSDRLGRKVVMTSQCVSLIVGSCLIASAMSFLQLIIGRIVIGSSFSFSMLSNVAWISEIVPPEKRGSAVSTYELCVTIGVLLAFIVNILTSSWRFAFLGVVPIALVQIVSLRFVPESPVWHMIKGDHGASHQVIANLGGTSAHLDHIRRVAGEHVQTQPFLETLKKWKIPFYVVTAVQGLGLLTGGINIRIFAERIFESVGITNSTADVLALLLGVTKVAVTIVAVFLMDKCGRRVFYMSGISLLVLANSLIALGAAMPGCFNSEGCDEDTVCSGIEIQRCPALCGHCSHYAAVLVVTGCVVGYAAYQISFGPLNFVIGSEMFPPHSRGRFLGIQVIIQGCFQLVTTLLFSAARYKITLSATVLFHTLFCIVGLMFITFFTVETRGKDPESILSYLKVKWA